MNIYQKELHSQLATVLPVLSSWSWHLASSHTHIKSWSDKNAWRTAKQKRHWSIRNWYHCTFANLFLLL